MLLTRFNENSTETRMLFKGLKTFVYFFVQSGTNIYWTFAAEKMTRFGTKSNF